MKSAIYLSRYTLSILALTLLIVGCTKDDSSSTPTYGFVKLGSGTDIKFSIVNESASGAYILTNQGPSKDETIGLTVQLPAKPSSTQKVALTENTSITYTKLKNGVIISTAYYGMPGDTIKADLVSGKVTLTLDDLPEVDIKHNPVASSTLRLSGKLSGR